MENRTINWTVIRRAVWLVVVVLVAILTAWSLSLPFQIWYRIGVLEMGVLLPVVLVHFELMIEERGRYQREMENLAWRVPVFGCFGVMSSMAVCLGVFVRDLLPSASRAMFDDLVGLPLLTLMALAAPFLVIRRLRHQDESPHT